MGSVLYLANTTAQTIATSGAINPGAIIRRTGSGIVLNGDTITINGAGYYSISVAATFTAATTGNVTVELWKDGAEVPGAEATETISTASTEARSIAFTTEIRTTCCNPYATITLINSQTGATFSNVAIKIKRDA